MKRNTSVPTILFYERTFGMQNQYDMMYQIL